MARGTELVWGAAEHLDRCPHGDAFRGRRGRAHRHLGRLAGDGALLADGRPRPRRIAERGVNGSTRSFAIALGLVAVYFVLRSVNLPDPALPAWTVIAV